MLPKGGLQRSQIQPFKLRLLIELVDGLILDFISIDGSAFGRFSIDDSGFGRFSIDGRGFDHVPIDRLVVIVVEVGLRLLGKVGNGEPVFDEVEGRRFVVDDEVFGEVLGRRFRHEELPVGREVLVRRLVGAPGP